MNSIRKSLAANGVIRPFFSASQLFVIEQACKGAQANLFIQKVVDIEKLIVSMPVITGQDGLDDDEIMVYLHYSDGCNDWFIAEKDMDGGATWAFGYTTLDNMKNCSGLGFISISDLVERGVEFDLYFKPCKLGEIKQRLAAAA
jgi:hypothetical protein